VRAGGARPRAFGQSASVRVAFSDVVEEEAGVPNPRTLGRALDGRYRLEAEIGVGGLGAVYRARHQKLDKSVAVKLLHQHCGSNELLRGRFEREARALATLDHPNIVTITDFGIAEDTPYLVMELLEGETLAERLDRGPLGGSEASKLIKELLAALRFVHGRALVHRDVKPSNVFLQRLPAGGERVKILDFGLAKFMGPDATPSQRPDPNPILTRAGAVVGTPAYMSPEQASGDSADARSDVYSTGVILFQMLTGQLPFNGDAIDQLRSHLVDPLPKMNDVQTRRVIRPELDAFLERATAKRREERFTDAGAMLAALEAVPEPWVLRDTVIGNTTIGNAKTQPLSASANELLVAESAQPPTADAPAEPTVAVQPRKFWTTGAQMFALTLFAGVATLAVFGARRAGLMDRAFGAESRHTLAAGARAGSQVASGSLPKGAAPGVTNVGVASPNVKGPAAAAGNAAAVAEANSAARSPQASQAVRDAVAEVAAGLEPVLQAARDDESALEHELGEREIAAPLPAASASQPRAPARNPWSRSALPKDLRDLRKAILNGARGNDRTVLTLRRYNREHVTDPRGHLLLAALYLNREWRADAINQYSIAYQRDASSRGAPEVLRSLIACVVQGQAAAEAERAIVGIYGAEAAPAIARASKAIKNDPKVVQRLQALRARLK
jgi:serine/threonine protein kinase